jgi:hypothetical protein
MSTKITDVNFLYGQLNYFRKNAHLIDIATFGKKKSPAGKAHYLDPFNKIERRHLVNRVTVGLPVSIDWSQTKQADVEVDGRQVLVYGVNASSAQIYSFAKVKSAKVVLYNLSISEGVLIPLLNGDADGARNFLATEGGDGRIVNEVWVVMEAKLAEHFKSFGSKSSSVSYAGANLNISVSGGTLGTQTITLSPGAIFAYKMERVTDWNAGKTHINKMEPDYFGG